MTLRDRPDPADVEIWEQLQRALTKLDQAERERDEALDRAARWVEQANRANDEEERLTSRAEQAEQREEELRRERDEADQRAEKWHTAWVNNANHMEARVEQAEVQRDALAVSLKGIKIAAQSWARGQDVETARRWHEIGATATQALDTLDQTNREGIQ